MLSSCLGSCQVMLDGKRQLDTLRLLLDRLLNPTTCFSRIRYDTAGIFTAGYYDTTAGEGSGQLGLGARVAASENPRAAI